MKQTLLKSAGIMIALFTLCGNTYGQQLQTSLFDEVDRMMANAKDAQADVLSPNKYDEAMEAYNDARKGYKEDGELAEIKKDIRRATGKFAEATDNTRVSSVMFSQAMSARRDAINAESYQFSKPLWKDAESEMKDAAIQLEKGDADDAKEKATKATNLYRKAELESIKANYLDNAKRLVEKADDDKVYKTAPKTLKEAKSLITQAEKALAENRYDTDEARHMAKEAEYKALLAMYIAKQADQLKKMDFETEDFLLVTYAQIGNIGESLNMDLKFNDGMDGPIAEIKTRLANDERQATNMEAAFYQSRKQNENLIALYKEQQKTQAALQGQLSEEALAAQKKQRDLQARIDRQAEIDSKFDQIQLLFTKEEAQVFRQKDDVIIRLIGVNFDIGKAEIKGEDYTVLTKVQKALKTFDFANFIVEGHTDSQGNDDTNLELSKQRAEAVLGYLTANTTIEKSRFSVMGFGESKPVANNETVLGRKKNRRIDIVIRPTILDTYVSTL